MGCLSLVWSKAILAVCNFLLLACGFCLITGGLVALTDTDRILLSRLIIQGPQPLPDPWPHPFLYYVVVGLASLGLILAATGVLGCWASCLNNYCILSLYFLIVILILLAECVIYIISWGWPSCLGISVERHDLTNSLQTYYGAAGQEQFTAAVDLAQTMFNCCGILTANEYDTSLWRLQPLGRPTLAIPLSCCKLENADHPKAYLNPVPVNTSLCQALEVNRHNGYRHLKGCEDSLMHWYRDHYLTFLAIGLIAVLIEFMVLLSTIFTCTKVCKHKQELKRGSRNAQSLYQRKSTVENAYTNDSYDRDDNSFRHNYKFADKA